jgi:hypothetical protein
MVRDTLATLHQPVRRFFLFYTESSQTENSGELKDVPVEEKGTSKYLRHTPMLTSSLSSQSWSSSLPTSPLS